jgi:hypothetical protein
MPAILARSIAINLGKIVSNSARWEDNKCAGVKKVGERFRLVHIKFIYNNSVFF